MDDGPNAHRALYRRACLNCAQSKCKCVYPAAGGKCQRCQHLNKDCHQPSSHKRQYARNSASSKAVRLEEKLENLTSLLYAGVQHPTPESVSSLPGQPKRSREASEKFTERAPRHGIAKDNESLQRHAPGVESTDHTNQAVYPPAEPSDFQAEVRLTIFQTQLLPYFPCVCIPPGTTAQQLRRERPFTWLCIMTITCKHVEQRRALDAKIKHIIAQCMVHGSEKTDLDFLSGLLIYLGWPNHLHGKANLYVFFQLLNATVYELDIHSPSTTPNAISEFLFIAGGETASPRAHTMEERRAVLATFLVTSIVSQSMRKTASLDWTPFMDESLVMLEEHQECLNDRILAHQVRLQLMTDTVIRESSHEIQHDIANPSQVLATSNIRSLDTQLEHIQICVPADSREYTILLLHYNYSRLIVHESTTDNITVGPMQFGTRNPESKHVCLGAIKAWFDIFLSIPLAEYVRFSLSIFTQLGHNLVVLHRLSTVNDPAWDTTAVRSAVDGLSILDTVINNIRQVASLTGLDGEFGGDAFCQAANKYSSARVRWEAGLDLDPSSLSGDMHSSETQPGLVDNMPIDVNWIDDIEWLARYN